MEETSELWTDRPVDRCFRHFEIHFFSEKHCIISSLLSTCSQLGCKKQETLGGEVFGTWTGFSVYVLHSQTVTRVSLSPLEGFQTHLDTGWLKLQALTSHISRFEKFKINTPTNLLLGEILCSVWSPLCVSLRWRER